jgi:hypothetical protein
LLGFGDSPHIVDFGDSPYMEGMAAPNNLAFVPSSLAICSMESLAFLANRSKDRIREDDIIGCELVDGS